MREIKFRAWDKINGNMLFDVSTGTIDIWSNPDGRKANSKDCKFMQFTGFHDKNGVGIYEGDIVEDTIRQKYEIKWIEEEGNLKAINKENIFRHFRDIQFMEVIGNIYENPKLLTN